MDDERVNENNEINIRHIYNMQMLCYNDKFTIENTYNEDWRLLCVYHGDVDVLVDNEWIPLITGYLVLTPPGAPYGLRTKSHTNSQILLITLACNGESINELTNEPRRVSGRNFELLNDIVSEAKYAFNLYPNNRQYDQYLPDKSISSSTRQILKNKLELFLLGFFNSGNNGANFLQEAPTVMLSKHILIKRIEEYFAEHISESITLKELSKTLNFSSSYLNSIFRNSTGKSIISAFTDMKIEQAKIYLEKNNYSVTQISESLGFSSVHYFSRVFKKSVGCSPSEYLEKYNIQRGKSFYE